jgi:hypothetical protein
MCVWQWKELLDFVVVAILWAGCGGVSLVYSIVLKDSHVLEVVHRDDLTN